MTEREALLYQSLYRLHLLNRAPKAEVVHDLLGLQAQFSRNPQISLRLRASDYDEDRWVEGLVKVWSHRGTIHVVPEHELGLYLSAKGNTGQFVDGAWGMTAVQQREWAPFIAEQIRSGNDTRDGLKNACLRAGMDDALMERVFYGWGGLIKEMAWRGMLVCRTGTDKRYAVPENVVFIERGEALKQLIRRYFTTYGPATVQDCAGFLGEKMALLRPLMDEVLPLLQCTILDGKRYYHAQPLITEGEIPPCVLIPGFDQLILGYRDRARMLDPIHARKLINVAGIVFSAILLRGKLRARWKMDAERVTVTPFERLLKKDEAAIRQTVRRQLGIRSMIWQDAEE